MPEVKELRVEAREGRNGIQVGDRIPMYSGAAVVGLREGRDNLILNLEGYKGERKVPLYSEIKINREVLTDAEALEGEIDAVVKRARRHYGGAINARKQTWDYMVKLRNDRAEQGWGHALDLDQAFEVAAAEYHHTLWHSVYLDAEATHADEELEAGAGEAWLRAIYRRKSMIMADLLGNYGSATSRSTSVASNITKDIDAQQQRRFLNDVKYMDVEHLLNAIGVDTKEKLR